MMCLKLFRLPFLSRVPVNCCLNLQQQILNGQVNVGKKLNRGDKKNYQEEETDHKVEGEFRISKRRDLIHKKTLDSDLLFSKQKYENQPK